VNKPDRIKVKVLESIRLFKKATPSMISGHLGYTPKTIQNAVQCLKKEGIVSACGSTKDREGRKGETVYAIETAFTPDGILFVPEYTPEVIKEFKRSIQGTPWDQLRACV
jgi:hypothetical protein